MQQWHARPATSIGHAVSPDLLRFDRLPDVLTSGTAGDEQCYDGSASIVSMASGVVTPMLMIDGGCGEQVNGNLPCMESRGNGSTGGITAFPENLRDLNLTTWRRSGPTIFEGCDGSAGPSPISLNPVTKKHQLIAIHGGGEALFEATSESLTSWTMVEKQFLSKRGGGGGLWRELPINVHGVPPSAGATRWPTHIMQLDDSMGDGRAEFSLIQVDAASSKVLNMTTVTPLDMSLGPRYGQISNAGGTASGGVSGDNRTIHISWLGSAPPGGDCAPGSIDVGQLTSFRDVRFDPRIGAFGALVETPIQEYETLRQAVIANHTIPITGQPAVALTLAAGPSAVDIELNISEIGVTMGSVEVGVGCSNITNECKDYVNLTATQSTSSNDRIAMVSMIVVDADREPVKNPAIFPIFPSESSALSLRIMTDTRSVEIFAANGRGVFSGGLTYGYCAQTACQVLVSRATLLSRSLSAVAPITVSVTAWTMGSIY